MYLELIGHDYKYAVEQIMLVLFPGERPVYDTPDPNASAVSSLTLSPVWATARTKLCWQGRQATGISRVQVSQLTDQLMRDRLLQRILKQSFYKAAVACTGVRPPWGALTGIRPAKLASRDLKAGLSEAQVREKFHREYFVSPARTELALAAARASLEAEKALSPEDLSLYVGIPFCPTRCVYCSFVSADVQKTFRLVDPYLAALHREIDRVGDYVRECGCRVKTLYVGGGTPTTLNADQLRELLEHLGRAFDLTSLSECTVEAGRPDTITWEKVQALRELGADRISVNPQSMNPKVLEAIGRSHTPEDIDRAFDLVRRAGFPVVNMDLIAGLPEDSLEGFRSSLDHVCALGPEHITVHTLALKKGARLMLESHPLPSGEETGAMLDYAWDKLSGLGLVPYYLYRQKYMSGALENIGWCVPGTEGLYNLCIMEELHTILALGAGGSTKLTDPKTGKIVRITNPKYPQQYIQRIDEICDSKAQLVPFQRALLERESALSESPTQPAARRH